MPKIQKQGKDGIFYVAIPRDVMKAFGWQKGLELFCQPDSLRREIVFREMPK